MTSPLERGPRPVRVAKCSGVYGDRSVASPDMVLGNTFVDEEMK